MHTWAHARAHTHSCAHAHLFAHTHTHTQEWTTEESRKSRRCMGYQQSERQILLHCLESFWAKHWKVASLSGDSEIIGDWPQKFFWGRRWTLNWTLSKSEKGYGRIKFEWTKASKFLKYWASLGSIERNYLILGGRDCSSGKVIGTWAKWPQFNHQDLH